MEIVIVIAVLAVMLLVLSYLAYLKAYHQSRSKKRRRSVLPGNEQYREVKSITDALVAEIKELEWEQIYITSRDGLRLAGKYHHVADGAPLQIQLHGYRGSAYRDFCGGNKLAREFGHNTLIVDQRAHGESEGHTISFGIKERFDCLDWIDYAIKRFGDDTKIILAGVSMGAATVIMAAGETLPENVLGVIADCPYSSPKEIILKVCGDMGLPKRASYPFICFSARIFGGFKLTECDVISAAARSKIPILLIHGEEDRFVPLMMSRQIAEANPERVTFVSFPGVGHGLSFVTDTERYKDVTFDFLSSIGAVN